MIEKQMVKNLKTYLDEIKELDEKIKVKKTAYEQDIADLSAKKKEITDKITHLKESISADAITEFKATGNKTLYGGVKVQESTTITYDEEKAFDFAKEKQMFLSFDKKGFEKAAPSLGLNWVTIKKEPKTTFPKEIKLND